MRSRTVAYQTGSSDTSEEEWGVCFFENVYCTARNFQFNRQYSVETNDCFPARTFEMLQ